MSQYYAQTRSNYFRVKNEAAFREWAESREIEVWNTDEDRGNYFSISSRESNGEGWRRLTFDEESNDPLDLNIAEELAEHLQDGSVAVLMEIGAEKLRYLVGEAIAVNSKGESVTVNLESIYDQAAHLGTEIIEATY